MLEFIFAEPKPCPCCGETRIYSGFVSWRDSRFLPFWVEMVCSRCGKRTKPRLFRSRAVAQWNREAEIPKNCRECAYAKGCKSWYGGLFCNHREAISRRVRV